jgi:hypothetical protein
MLAKSREGQVLILSSGKSARFLGKQQEVGRGRDCEILDHEKHACTIMRTHQLDDLHCLYGADKLAKLRCRNSPGDMHEDEGKTGWLG